MSRKRPPLLSTIGTKTTMAVTGLLLLGFVLVHMLGNLQVYAGREKLNAYAKLLQDAGGVLWVARGGLLAVFVLHVVSAFRVAAMNKAARPVPYVSAVPQVTSTAARTMLLSGLVVAAFVVYHVLHFTLGVVDAGNHGHLDAKGRHDVYGMVVAGFRQWPIALSYVVAQVLLFFHLAHGVSSAFQTLGVTHPRLAFLKGRFGTVVAGVVLVGNVSIPLTILLGLVPCGAC